jgi:hypothetical protein
MALYCLLVVAIVEVYKTFNDQITKLGSRYQNARACQI